jgi:hypothetical protein
VSDPADAAWLDARRLTLADIGVGSAAGLFLIWSLLPVWYVFVPGGVPVEGFAFRVNAWHGITPVAAVLAIVGVALVVLRMARREVRIGRRVGLLDLAVAVAAEVVTVLGLVVQPEFFDPAWGLFVGMALGLLWVLAARARAVGPDRRAPS